MKASLDLYRTSEVLIGILAIITVLFLCVTITSCSENSSHKTVSVSSLTTNDAESVVYLYIPAAEKAI
ncbi:MAG: hypothetical protein LBU90_05195 [Bacteroidales bacterium]|jgi:uncharacterized protein (UPF0333 family)|nr:hypothetical protein [Bacteroidales bacterium]